jgi:hypothetical protein
MNPSVQVTLPASCGASAAGNGSSPTITCRDPPCSHFDWEPLVQKACDEYSQAISVAPNTRGYFGQVANIVCAASKSTNPCCRDMFKYYNKPGCSDNWAGAFDQFVFKVSSCPAVFRSK